MVIKIKSKATMSKSLRNHLKLKILYFVNVTMRFGEHNLCVYVNVHICVFFPWGEIISNRTKARAKCLIYSSKYVCIAI